MTVTYHHINCGPAPPLNPPHNHDHNQDHDYNLGHEEGSLRMMTVVQGQEGVADQGVRPAAGQAAGATS